MQNLVFLARQSTLQIKTFTRLFGSYLEGWEQPGNDDL